MTDDDLSPQVAEGLRRLGAGPEPTPTRELAALFVRGAPGRRRAERLARHGVPFGIAVKVLLGTGVLGAASVGAAHVVTHHPVPHDGPPAVVVPASEPPSHDRPTPKREPSRTARPERPVQRGDEDNSPPGEATSHPSGDGTGRAPDSSDGDSAGQTGSGSDDGSDGGG